MLYKLIIVGLTKRNIEHYMPDYDSAEAEAKTLLMSVQKGSYVTVFIMWTNGWNEWKELVKFSSVD